VRTFLVEYFTACGDFELLTVDAESIFQAVQKCELELVGVVSLHVEPDDQEE